MTIKFVSDIGKTYDSSPAKQPFQLDSHPEFTFNTPVGLCCDNYKRVWIADTGNNRLVIMDAQLQRVMKVYGEPGAGNQQFNMPFRLVHHPSKPLIYVSDMANRRIHILSYSRNLVIQQVSLFGDSGPEQHRLVGPNGLTFVGDTLCIADEFYVNSEGGGRIVLFSEQGKYLSSIENISGASDPGLLWPQGLSADNQGNLYIANTGFYNVVRCDLQGNGVAFPATGTVEIDGLDLSRDVSVIDDLIYIPGGTANKIDRYLLDGQPLDPLGEFFAPIQVTKHPSRKKQLLVVEPILATVNAVEPLLNTAIVKRSAGNARNNQGQFHFITSATATSISEQKATPTRQANNPLGLMMDFWLRWLEFGVNLWQPNSNHQTDAWILDSANRQIKKSPLQVTGKESQVKSESYFPLIPGALGIEAFHPAKPLPEQMAPGTAVFFVTNYLSGFVSLLQYNPFLDDLVHFTFFGGYGSEPWQLKRPQGLAIHSPSGNIYIADSGNNRISHWRINRFGIVGLVGTFGEEGQGNGQFKTPSDITVDKEGKLYVTDQFNNRIQVFDKDGNYLSQFGQGGYGTDSSNFLLPTSIQSSNGHLVVNDLVNRAIKVFKQDGSFVTSYSGMGAIPESGQLWMPYLLHANDKQILVPDCALNRVNIYQYATPKEGS